MGRWDIGYIFKEVPLRKITSTYQHVFATQGKFSDRIQVDFRKLLTDWEPHITGYILYRRSQRDQYWRELRRRSLSMKDKMRDSITEGIYIKSAQSYIDRNVRPGIIYEYTVAPYNEKGHGPLSRICKGWAKGKVYRRQPIVPAGLRVYCPERGKMIVIWKESKNTRGYYVYRWHDERSLFVKLGYTEKTYFEDFTIKSSEKYRYGVCSFNWAGESSKMARHLDEVEAR
jgi:hypothetical protein